MCQPLKSALTTFPESKKILQIGREIVLGDKEYKNYSAQIIELFS